VPRDVAVSLGFVDPPLRRVEKLPPLPHPSTVGLRAEHLPALLLWQLFVELEVFLLDRFAPFPTTGTVSLPTGIALEGTNTLQVNYIVGDQTATYEARGSVPSRAACGTTSILLLYPVTLVLIIPPTSISTPW
jgi:hypothetical protein